MLGASFEEGLTEDSCFTFFLFLLKPRLVSARRLVQNSRGGLWDPAMGEAVRMCTNCYEKTTLRTFNTTLRSSINGIS